MKIAIALRALANERRLLILDWLRDPERHFRPQVDGDLVEDGVCGLLIAEKLGVSAPTLSEHMRVLIAAKLVRAKRIKQWTMYKRDEDAIAAVKRVIQEKVCPASGVGPSSSCQGHGRAEATPFCERLCPP